MAHYSDNDLSGSEKELIRRTRPFKGKDLNEDQVLLAMALVARRASSWAHDLICSKPISDGKISADAVERFKKEIQSALAILDRDSP